jgi:hypothetical protein
MKALRITLSFCRPSYYPFPCLPRVATVDDQAHHTVTALTPSKKPHSAGRHDGHYEDGHGSSHKGGALQEQQDLQSISGPEARD